LSKKDIHTLIKGVFFFFFEGIKGVFGCSFWTWTQKNFKALLCSNQW